MAPSSLLAKEIEILRGYLANTTITKEIIVLTIQQY
jgi:hypothetical protein